MKNHLKFTTVTWDTDFKWWQPNTQACGSVNLWNENHIHTPNLKTEVSSKDWKNWQLPRSPHQAIRMSNANCNCFRACALQVKRPLILNAVSSINSYFNLEPDSFPNRVMPDKDSIPENTQCLHSIKTVYSNAYKWQCWGDNGDNQFPKIRTPNYPWVFHIVRN